MTLPSGTTNQNTPSQGEPFVIPSFGNVGPPLMATLNVPRLTIGLLYGYSLFQLSQVYRLFQIQTLHYKSINIMLIFHLLHQMCILPFILFSLLKVMMLVIKWIRRRIKTNTKHNLKKLLLIVLRVLICPQKHLVSVSYLADFVRVTIFKQDCHGLFQVLEVWYNASQQAMFLASGHHTGDAPPTSESMVKSIKGKVINPTLLCK